MNLYNLTRRCYLVAQGEAANSYWAKLRGLIGHHPLRLGEGLLIKGCRWIHTFFMSFPIDVLYLDRQNRVSYLTPDMIPNRIGPFVSQAHLVVELPSGIIARTRTAIGDQLEIGLEADIRGQTRPDVDVQKGLKGSIQ